MNSEVYSVKYRQIHYTTYIHIHTNTTILRVSAVKNSCLPLLITVWCGLTTATRSRAIQVQGAYTVVLHYVVASRYYIDLVGSYYLSTSVFEYYTRVHVQL